MGPREVEGGGRLHWRSVALMLAGEEVLGRTDKEAHEEGTAGVLSARAVEPDRPPLRHALHERLDSLDVAPEQAATQEGCARAKGGWHALLLGET